MANFDPAGYQPAQNLLEDRVILVTGAGSGLGRAAARSFAARGASVILHGRTLSKLERVYDEIVADQSPEPAIAPLNLLKASAPDYFALRDRIQDDYGRLDGLLHNAGILGTLTPLAQYDVNTWAEVMHVNLTVPFVLTQVLLPLLGNAADASVVFTSSGVGRRGRAYWGAYAVSKFGIEGLSQVLADEAEEAGRLRANAINPGRTRTGMRAAAYPAEDPNSLPAPESLMPTYLYLMGPDSRGVTGETFDCQT